MPFLRALHDQAGLQKSWDKLQPMVLEAHSLKLEALAHALFRLPVPLHSWFMMAWGQSSDKLASAMGYNAPPPKKVHFAVKMINKPGSSTFTRLGLHGHICYKPR